MLLIDGDRVEESNLNRQILYTEADIGRLKVEAAADRLGAFNSRMPPGDDPGDGSTARTAIAGPIEGYDVVIDAADWPAHEIEQWCNAACFAAEIPYITMSHFPPIARVGPLYVPGVTGCFACQVAAYRRSYPMFDVAIEQRRAKPAPAATLGPACGLIGGQVGLDVMHHLTGLADALDPGRRPHLRPAHDGGRTRAGRAGARLPRLRPPADGGAARARARRRRGASRSARAAARVARLWPCRAAVRFRTRVVRFDRPLALLVVLTALADRLRLVGRAREPTATATTPPAPPGASARGCGETTVAGTEAPARDRRRLRHRARASWRPGRRRPAASPAAAPRALPARSTASTAASRPPPTVASPSPAPAPAARSPSSPRG